jgi:hypothetical protein
MWASRSMVDAFSRSRSCSNPAVRTLRWQAGGHGRSYTSHDVYVDYHLESGEYDLPVAIDGRSEP